MALPALGTDKFGLMPTGRHDATLDEVEAQFVTAAPFATERRVVWSAFTLWVGKFRTLFPTAILWINGGFVTHKTWAAPKDVDVFALVRQSEAAAVQAAGTEADLIPLLTDIGDGVQPRVQPMSGMVDGFFALRGDVAATPVVRSFEDTWSRVKDENGVVVPDLRKGYVVVKP